MASLLHIYGTVLGINKTWLLVWIETPEDIPAVLQRQEAIVWEQWLWELPNGVYPLDIFAWQRYALAHRYMHKTAQIV